MIVKIQFRVVLGSLITRIVFIKKKKITRIVLTGKIKIQMVGLLGLSITSLPKFPSDPKFDIFIVNCLETSFVFFSFFIFLKLSK